MGERTGRLLAQPLVWLVRAYQVLVSPLLGPTCRYYPSCSSYAIQSLQRFGPLTGGWLALRRLSRCHPWSDGGVDHVPPRRNRTVRHTTQPTCARPPGGPAPAPRPRKSWVS